MKCPFCRPEQPVVAENRYVYVIHDKNPYVEGHLLVIPKKHYENIIEMDDRVLCETIKMVKRMEKRLIEKMGVEGITVRQNWLPFLKKNRLVVGHVHFHIIPRNLNDGLYYAAKRKRYNASKIRDITKLLKL
ncbi:MAG: HIT family protein [Candidatus Micrarchaeia archaeon]